MQTIPLDDLPAQELTVQLDGAFWAFRFVTAGTVTLVDVMRDNVQLLTGQRVLAGEWVLPFPYQERGNFLMLTEGDALPFYDEPREMVYFSPDELAIVRA